jgi:hypothetical protein
MNILNYFEKLNEKSQEIYAIALKEPLLLGKAHSSASEIYELSKFITDTDEQQMLGVVSSQIEASCLALSLGLYRPAMSTLRLALELGLGCIYFSANKFAHREWMNGGDLKWSTITSDQDGVFSTRFRKAFFVNLEDENLTYRERALSVFRKLSEYVHGNNETWKINGISLQNNTGLRSLYANQLDEVVTVIKFAFCVRYLKSIDKANCENVSSILEEFNYIAAIREHLGGPKEIK